MKNARSQIPPEWSWHYQTLQKLRAALLQEHDEHSAAACKPHEVGGTDAIDVATDESEHKTLLAELSHEESKLAEIDAALERLRRGTYGICEVTGQPISTERLRALPWTRLSQEAASRMEKRTRA